ncbi:extracellular solute-binding protein [Paenibacillus koleovorans]|uniref:extracellular solute-binding protein n=1 Tax=Paenibacillus koleovorans TaxID=121608 RepID=UPI000FD71736|nr:extracellular solute-binding protein [Paenibacillus koleovorans]
MKKRFTMLPIAVISIAALVTACSNGTEGTSGTSGSSSPTPTATVNKEPASFTILNNDGGEAYAKTAQKDDQIYTQMSKLFSDYIGAPTTINYEFLPATGYSEQLTVRFASKDVPQVIATGSIMDKGHPTAVENGIFVDLTAMIDKYGTNLKKNIPDFVWQNPKVSQNGKIYAIPKLLTPTETRGFIVRKDWLDKLGMKPPETLDDYLAFFEAVKTKDPNGNGQADEVGFVARSDFGNSQVFFAAFGLYTGSVQGAGGTAWQFVNNQFIPDIINPKMKDAIAFYKKLYDNGYMNRDWVTAKAADMTKMIQDDKVAFWNLDIRQLGSYAPSAFASKKGVIDVLPGFKDSKGEFFMGFKGLPIAKVHAVISGTKNPERFVQFMDWTYSNDQKKNDFFAFGIKDRNYTGEGAAAVWDGNSDMNKKEKTFIQTMINPAGDSRMDDRVVKLGGTIDPNVLKKATDYALNNTKNDPGINMPVPEVMATTPELGAGTGTLFMDAFTKIVTGKDDLNTGWDKYVADWKKRGGDAVIKEATEWYNKNNKK